jgi:hypothetical protein
VPSSLSLLAALNAVAFAIIGLTVVVIILAVLAIINEAVVLWAASSNP